MGSFSPLELITSGAALDGLRFSVVNHGCKVNRVEADTVAANLMARNAVFTDSDDVDVVFVNTCTVTGEADRKARKAVRHALGASPGATVVVTGCGVAIDASGFESLDQRVRAVARADLLRATAPPEGEPLRTGADFRTRVNIKIQDGCDHACTYCIVHVARGKARSVPSEAIATRARAYLAAGARELVLTGIDLGSYRDGDVGLAALAGALLSSCKELERQKGASARVRASSLEPMSIDDEFIGLLASEQGKLCRHLHVPLQSGSSKVLAEMARPYSADDYIRLVGRLRADVPQISLTTDIIVGFPGETEQDFEQTLCLARECGFSKIHVFPYSKRAGTPAAERADQVDPDVKRERAARLRRLSGELRAADLRTRKNTTELALVETRFALTESYHEIALPPTAETGQLVPVVL